MTILSTPQLRIQHLLRRAAFGYRSDDLDQYVTLGLEGTVDRLLHPETVDDSATEALLAPTLAPFALDFRDKQVQADQRAALYRAWYVRMVSTRRPFLERMTYFWHGHFATALSKVAIPAFMQKQNDTLRAGALGSFHDLLVAVARDPAMLVYLDNRTNAKGAPNENYARELMELHTLGHGNGYTENDVHEVARALTGWRITADGNSELAQRLQDTGTKTILGHTGNFDEAGVLALLAGSPTTAAFLAGKLVRAFVHPDGDAGLEQRVADTYLQTNGSIREVMRTILLSDEMYGDRAYRALIKSPTEFILGARRALESSTDGRVDADVARRLGQLLYEPPNPAGWTGGTTWMNATTTLGRSNFIADLTSLHSKNAADIPALLRKHGATETANAVVDWTLNLLVGGDVEAGTRQVLVDHLGGDVHFNFEQAARDGTLQGMVYLAMSMPLYQVA